MTHILFSLMGDLTEDPDVGPLEPARRRSAIYKEQRLGERTIPIQPFAVLPVAPSKCVDRNPDDSGKPYVQLTILVFIFIKGHESTDFVATLVYTYKYHQTREDFKTAIARCLKLQ